MKKAFTWLLSKWSPNLIGFFAFGPLFVMVPIFLIPKAAQYGPPSFLSITLLIVSGVVASLAPWILGVTLTCLIGRVGVNSIAQELQDEGSLFVKWRGKWAEGRWGSVRFATDITPAKKADPDRRKPATPEKSKKFFEVEFWGGEPIPIPLWIGRHFFTLAPAPAEQEQVAEV